MRRLISQSLVAMTLAFGAKTAGAQSRVNGEIRGIVSDSSGAVIPAVDVTIRNVSTGLENHVLTDASGLYDVPSVPPGDYVLTFVKPGFGQLKRTGVTLQLETITIDAVLTVGAVASTVEVNAQSPLVQTENAEQAAYLSADAVNNIPNVGRSYF